MLALVMSLLLLGDFPELAARLQQDPLYAPPVVLEQAARAVDRGGNPIDRLTGLLDYLFSKDGVAFQYSNETVPVPDLLKEGRGNCLSFAQAVVLLARHLGLPAHFREVEIIPVWSLKGRVVVLSQHINVAVFIGSRLYLVDLLPEIRALTIRGDIIDDNRARAHYFSNLGADYLSRNQPAAAQMCFRKALEWDESADFAWTNLGASLVFAGELQKAERIYRRALEVNSENMAAMSNLALLYRRMGKDHLAAGFERKVREFQRKNPYHHYALGLEAFQEEQWEEVVVHLLRAIRLKKQEPRFYSVLAQAYAHMGRTDEMAEALRSAVKFAQTDEERARYEEKLELLAQLETKQ